MSANRLFLVCKHHPQLEEAFCVGERLSGESQYIAPHLRRLDDWYAKHQGCGAGCDHFQIAYNRPLDWDVPTPADPIAATVRVELAKAGLQ